MIANERQLIALEALNRLTPVRREILDRFYLQEQSAGQICREMGLTKTQYRLAKSRAKALFGSEGQRLERLRLCLSFD